MTTRYLDHRASRNTGTEPGPGLDRVWWDDVSAVFTCLKAHYTEVFTFTLLMIIHQKSQCVCVLSTVMLILKYPVQNIVIFCWAVGRISQKLVNIFPPNADGGRVSQQIPLMIGSDPEWRKRSRNFNIFISLSGTLICSPPQDTKSLQVLDWWSDPMAGWCWYRY